METSEQPRDGEVLPPVRPGHWWKPGQSGNPSGRSHNEERKLVTEAARRYSVVAIEVLADIMLNGRKEQNRLMAANMMIIHAWGKPQPASGDPADRARTLEQILQAIADARTEKQAQSSQNQSEKAE